MYSGDANYLSSTSAVVAETISPITSGVVVSSSPNPSIFNQPVTVTATVGVHYPVRSQYAIANINK